MTGVDAGGENVKIAESHADLDIRPRTESGAPGSLCYLHKTAGLNERMWEVIAEELVADQHPQFDVVCALEIIEHVINVPLFLKSCAAMVKVFYFSVPWSF